MTATELTPEEGERLFEQDVQRRLGLDTPTFVRLWDAGLLDPCDPGVRMVAILLPLVRHRYPRLDTEGSETCRSSANAQSPSKRPA